MLISLQSVTWPRASNGQERRTAVTAKAESNLRRGFIYFPSFPDAPAISVDSIMPTVRLAATKVLLATRRTSALVTLSMRSTSWKK